MATILRTKAGTARQHPRRWFARGASSEPRTYRPSLEVLESRPLLAQILLGGDVLKETFDDLPSTTDTSNNSLADPGYLSGVAVQSPPFLFSHSFDGVGAINPGGDTTPTAQPPGQTAQDLRLVAGPNLGTGNLTDILFIHPYLPAGASNAEVDQVSLDVKSSQRVQLTVSGKNGKEVLPPASAANAFTTLAASANDVIGTDAAGNDIKLGEIFLVQVDMHPTIATDFVELDNVDALVFFPGISMPPVARDDVFELPQGAMPGQSFVSTAITVSDPNGSVLDNDSSASSGALTATPIRLPAHGQLAWSSDNSGLFIYIPDSTFQGTDSFTYVASDGKSVSNTATVTIVTKGSPLDTDGDGVPDDVEALAPPKPSGVYGDANSDGTPDYLESKVASLPAVDHQYWTLVTSGGAFQNVSNVALPASPPLPPHVSLPSGLFGFQVVGLPAGGSAVVTLTPDSSAGTGNANGFVLFDPVTKTWSEFPSFAPTGVLGADVSGTEVTLHLIDGRAGDQDGLADGMITLLGGPAGIGPLAQDGSVTFTHQAGDFSAPPPLAGQVTFTPPPGGSATVFKVPGSEMGGTVDLAPDGSFIWHGSQMQGSFQFGVSASNGESSTATETIQINDIPPRIFFHFKDYDFTTLFNIGEFPNLTDVNLAKSAAVEVIGSTMTSNGNYVDASDIVGHHLSIIVVQQPIRAKVFQVNTDGTIMYFPLDDFQGIDAFKIKFNDGYLDSEIFTADMYDFVPLPHQPTLTETSTVYNEAELQVPVPVPTAGGKYEALTLTELNPQASVTAFQPVANPSPAEDFPPGTSAADFPLGFFQFTVKDGSTFGGFNVKLSLPSDAPTPTKYYKFGPTPDDATPHWYDFTYDADPNSPDYGTGAEIIPGAIVLHFLYGKRGIDSHSTVTGESVDAGGPGFFAPVGAVTGPANGTPGQPVMFSLSATDLAPSVLAAGFTYTINWGDGSPVQTIAAAPGNGAGITEAHVFDHPGTFTVQVTATDNHGLASDVAMASILIAEPSVVTPSPTPPQVLKIVVADQSRKGLTALAIIFNESLTGGSATNANLYHVFEGVKKVVKKHKETVFIKRLPIRDISLNTSGDMVTIKLARAFKGSAEVVVQGTVTATNGASGSVNAVKTL
jgi:hypothetical protein